MRILRRNPRWRGDEGLTLAMVLFVTMIGIAIAVALATSVVFTNNRVALGRETVQARAAAETGLDTALAAFEQRSGTTLPCSLSGTASGVATGSASQPTYAVTLTYYDAAGTPLTCSPSTGVSATPSLVSILSTGKSYPAFGGAPQNQRQMEAAVQLRAGTASWADNFKRAVFSNGSMTSTNTWALNGAGADFYTNGNFGCNSSSRFDGSVYSQGTGSMTNTCRILGDLWTKNAITTSTTGISVGGSIKSSTAGLSMGNNPVSIGGNIVLAGALVKSDGHSPTVGGTISQNLGAFAYPPSETFPKVTFTQTDWTNQGWTYMTWLDYIDSIRTVPPAASWWTRSVSNYCTIAYQSYSLNKAMVSPLTKTVLDARASGQCSQLKWNGNSAANQLKLRNDLTIITSNFYNTGSLTVTSVEADGVTPSATPRTLRIIVPWTATQTSCASGTTMKFDAGGTSFASNVTTFLYSSGNVELTNGISLSGQIYGCQVTASVATTINFVKVGAPSDATTAGTYQADVLYKRDT